MVIILPLKKQEKLPQRASSHFNVLLKCPGMGMLSICLELFTFFSLWHGGQYLDQIKMSLCTLITPDKLSGNYPDKTFCSPCKSQNFIQKIILCYFCTKAPRQVTALAVSLNVICLSEAKVDVGRRLGERMGKQVVLFLLSTYNQICLFFLFFFNMTMANITCDVALLAKTSKVFTKQLFYLGMLRSSLLDKCWYKLEIHKSFFLAYS